MELIVYVSADKIIISNKSDKNYIEKIFPVKKNKLQLIRNFIDTDHFCCNNTNPIGENKKKALFIGRIEQRKNVENLMYGCKASNCTLNIVGQGKNELYFKNIAIKMNADIHFHGTIDNNEMPEIICQNDLFILPSFYENNPKVLLEAMACGRVVLGTNVPGIRELIDDGKTGFLCDTDSLSISNAIQRIFNIPDETLNVIAKNARQFVAKECAIENVYRQEMNIYRGLLP